MANVTDSLANVGTDPQNLMEYLTRQKIYDSRYWKESCFGLTVADVLETTVKQVHTVGGLSTRFIALLLKLLQLNPEPELIIDTYINNCKSFVYVRALGCLYIRLTGRPGLVYNTLEPLYKDYTRLRYYDSLTCLYKQSYHFDEFIHDLLTATHVVNIALPRLPQRRALYEAGYLDDEYRKSGLEIENNITSIEEYLREKAQTSEAAKELLMKRKHNILPVDSIDDDTSIEKKLDKETDITKEVNKKSKKSKQRNYDNLFKKSEKTKKQKIATDTKSTDNTEKDSEEYWNEERAKLGLKPLK